MKVLYLLEADDCHGGAGDHNEDADDKEDVSDFVLERTLGIIPVGNHEFLMSEILILAKFTTRHAASPAARHFQPFL